MKTIKKAVFKKKVVKKKTAKKTIKKKAVKKPTGKKKAAVEAAADRVIKITITHTIKYGEDKQNTKVDLTGTRSHVECLGLMAAATQMIDEGNRKEVIK